MGQTGTLDDARIRQRLPDNPRQPSVLLHAEFSRQADGEGECFELFFLFELSLQGADRAHVPRDAVEQFSAGDGETEQKNGQNGGGAVS